MRWAIVVTIEVRQWAEDCLQRAPGCGMVSFSIAASGAIGGGSGACAASFTCAHRCTGRWCTHIHIQAHVTFFIRKVLKVPSSFHFGHPSLSSVSCRPFENLTGDSWLSPPDILIWHRLFRLAQKCSVSPSCTGQASLCWQSDTSRSLDTQAAALLGTQAAAQTRQSICATNKEVVQQFLGRQ